MDREKATIAPKKSTFPGVFFGGKLGSKRVPNRTSTLSGRKPLFSSCGDATPAPDKHLGWAKPPFGFPAWVTFFSSTGIEAVRGSTGVGLEVEELSTSIEVFRMPIELNWD